MDEILIADKKYVSSKRAAKITGYAKDYIGQLCREGRVPARLVGRSWYVLESAIQDHRFGESVAEKKEKISDSPIPQETWESPRYEAATSEILPDISRLRDSKDRLEGEGLRDSAEHLQATWQAWFSRVAPQSTYQAQVEERHIEEEEARVEPEIQEIQQEEATEITKEEIQEVKIPIHAHYEAPRERRIIQEPQESQVDLYIPRRSKNKGYTRIIQLTGALVGLIAVITTLFGTGLFDSYIISSEQASVIAGISFYNK